MRLLHFRYRRALSRRSGRGRRDQPGIAPTKNNQALGIKWADDYELEAMIRVQDRDLLPAIALE